MLPPNNLPVDIYLLPWNKLVVDDPLHIFFHNQLCPSCYGPPPITNALLSRMQYNSGFLRIVPSASRSSCTCFSLFSIKMHYLREIFQSQEDFLSGNLARQTVLSIWKALIQALLQDLVHCLHVCWLCLQCEVVCLQDGYHKGYFPVQFFCS